MGNLRARSLVSNKSLDKETVALRKHLERPYERLSQAEREHAERTCDVALVLYKEFKNDPGFRRLKLDPNFLILSVLYHDIGKAKIPTEYHFADKLETDEEKEIYNDHIKYGLEYIKFGDENTSLISYLSCAIKYHHGAVGKRFPAFGMLVYIADSLDNLFYDQESSTLNEEGYTKESFLKAYRLIVGSFEKNGVYPTFIARLQKPEVVVSLFNVINKGFVKLPDDAIVEENAKNKIEVVANRVYDMFKYNDAIVGSSNTLETHEVIGYNVSYDLKSIDFGTIRHDEFVYFACKNDLVKKLDAFFIEDFLTKPEITLGMRDKLIFVTISLESLNKMFVRRLVKYSKVNDIDKTKIVVTLDLYYNDMTETQLGAYQDLKKLGFKVGVNGARSEYINIFKDKSIDYAIYNNSSTSELDEMFIDLIESNGTTVILTKPSKRNYRYICYKDSSIDPMMLGKEGDVSEEQTG